MAVSTKHVLQQGPVIATLASVALSGLRQQLGRGPAPSMPAVPGPEISATITPRPPPLLRAYIKHVGGDPSAYRGQVPAHFFPQWGFPMASRTLAGLPYPMFKVLNGGCRLEINGPLPAKEALHARARLEDIDDNGRRAVIHQRVATSTGAHPDAVVGHLYAVVPLGGKGDGPKGKRKERPRVPQDAEELQRWRLRPDAGLDFAKLTGDFNPVHWIPSYARAFGFRNTILHGFSTMPGPWRACSARSLPARCAGSGCSTSSSPSRWCSPPRWASMSRTGRSGSATRPAGPRTCRAPSKPTTKGPRHE